MSKANLDQAKTANQKEYHRPKLRKFGNVSDLTLANSSNVSNPPDGGSFPLLYAS